MSLFSRKPKNLQPAPFLKEALSDAALDHFAEAYQVDAASQPEVYTFPYVKADGTKIVISGKKLFSDGSSARSHFAYLLGQTAAYHKSGNSISDLLYSLRELMYIVDEAGNRIPWTNRKQTIIQFAKLADEQGFLLEPPEEFRSSSDPQYGRVPEVVPVIHTTHKP